MSAHQNPAVTLAWTGMSWSTSVSLAPDVKDAVSSCILVLGKIISSKVQFVGGVCIEGMPLTLFQLMN